MKKIKGAIFDLDGTILDSMHIWPQIDEDFLGRRGITLPEDYIKEISAMGFHEIAIYTKERFSLAETLDEIKNEWNEMSVMAYATAIGLKPGAKEFLKLLKDNGVKMSVATASNELLFMPALENNEILGYFDAFTTLAEVKNGKGSSDIYFKAAEKIGVSAKECVVFEDLYDGLRAARRDGFFTVGVKENLAVVSQEKIKEESDIYINDFYELINNNVFIERLKKNA
ncbi:MAG: HAD family phosphatase [Ruminococcaceae bacterium]|nr:HAD family phosphatase [Oscillospiraceae bacterium]